MKRSLFVKSLALLLAALSIAAVPSASTEVDVSKVFGRIRIVEGVADFDVRIVENFPDLRVRVVDSLPNRCGQWEFVTFAEDFTVCFVEHGEDFTVEFVENFEGLP